MTALAHPRRRAPWADARFFIGVALVAASVVGVWLVVTSAQRTSPVFVAARTIVPGDVVTEGDLRIVEAALGTGEAAYLSAEDLAEGRTATRTIAEGEFVPRSAVVDVAAAGMTTVVIRSATAVPASVQRGATVDLWSAPAEEHGGFGIPAVLVADATVSAVGSAERIMGDGSSSLELVIPRADVARTLAAVAAGAALSIVPTAAAQ